MSFEKQHLSTAFFSRFNLKKNAAEAKEMICSTLDEITQYM